MAYTFVKRRVSLPTIKGKTRRALQKYVIENSNKRCYQMKITRRCQIVDKVVVAANFKEAWWKKTLKTNW
jgi:hypothetical protein